MESSSVRRNPVVVACGADAKYSMSLAVTLYSLLIHMERGACIELYIVDGGMGEAVKARLRQVVVHAAEEQTLDCNLHLIAIEENVASMLQALPQVGHLNYTAYLRLLLPDLLPISQEKVIYIDSDMMFLQNVQELWETDVSDKSVLAVQDYMIQTVSSPLGLGDYADLGYAPDHFYFNSGLLVINLKRWREDQVSAQVMHYNQSRRAYIKFSDQDGLNAVLGKDCGFLDLRWNVTILSLDLNEWSDSELKDRVRPRLAELSKHPSVIHYVAGSKPWLVANFALLRPQWCRFLWHCGWFTRPEAIAYFSGWMMRCTLAYAGNAWQKGVRGTPLNRWFSGDHSAA